MAANWAGRLQMGHAHAACRIAPAPYAASCPRAPQCVAVHASHWASAPHVCPPSAALPMHSNVTDKQAHLLTGAMQSCGP